MSDLKYMQVVNQIRHKIRTGQYAPGAKLPGHLMIAREFSVSAITANRALVELEKQGLIVRKERSGSFVSQDLDFISDVVVIMERQLDCESQQPLEYWQGITAAAEEQGISIQVVCVSDPKIEEIIEFKPSVGLGIITLCELPDFLMRKFKKTGIPYVCIGHRIDQAYYCVSEDHSRAAIELVEAMIEDGCKCIGYIGDLYSTNHRIVRDGYVEATRKLGIGYRCIRDASGQPASDILNDLLDSEPDLDGLVVMGGRLPFAVFPEFFSKARDVKLAVLTEDSTVLQLRENAYVAYYSQRETGKLALDLLREIASGGSGVARTLFSPYQILRPAQDLEL